MKKQIVVCIFSGLFWLVSCPAAYFSLDIGGLGTDNVSFDIEIQYDSVRPLTGSALAVKFELAENWHFYASGPTKLKVIPASQKDFITFQEPIFPASEKYTIEQLNETIDVFSGSFSVYLPFEVGAAGLQEGESIDVQLQVIVDGPMCSGPKCTIPTFEPLNTRIKVTADAPMTTAAFEIPQAATVVGKTKTSVVRGPDYSIWAALSLAFLAGLILNIMPCVLPVIPLKVLGIFEQAKHRKGRCIAMGLSFCAGILLFFAALAVFNIVLRLGYNRAFQWGQHFRNPGFLIGMSALLVVLALFLFGVVTFAAPSSLGGKSEARKGVPGSVGMGFLAAVLGTPCSFAILTAAFAWAQAQRLFLSTIAIMLIGVGMAAPYLILTSMPSLLKYLPKPGRWMELFKQAMGFVLLAVALWLIDALPDDRIAGTLYFCFVLAFCFWMWGGGVTYNTTRVKKYIIRLIAVAVVIPAGLVFLPKPPPSRVNWLEYDSAKIQEAVKRQKPVLIDFTADWCPNCRVVDKFVYENKSIAGLIAKKGVQAFKADVTLENVPATKDLEKVYQEPAIPVTILYMPGQAVAERLPGIAIGKELKKLLNKLPEVPAVEDPNE